MATNKTTVVLKKIQKPLNNKKNPYNSHEDQDNSKHDPKKLSDLLDDIIKICPKIKSDKQFIINKLTATDQTIDEYILDQIILPKGTYKQDMFNVFTENTEIYYIDPFDNIIDTTCNIVGICNSTGIGAKYMFFKAIPILSDTLPTKFII